MKTEIRKTDDEKQYRTRCYPRCTVLVNGAVHSGELVDISLRGALFAPERAIENGASKACRLYLEGRESTMNGFVLQDGVLLCIKFVGLRHAEQKVIEALALPDTKTSEPEIERDTADLMRRRSRLILMELQ